MHALRPGADFAGYRIERVLGVGGMGSVYAARHPRLPRLVALKLLHSSFAEDPVFRGRFEREAELAGRLDHPNIVTIHDRGREGSQLWISMQYVEGTDAETAVRTGQMPPLRALYVAAATADALDYAHRAGMLHRDVKPANILIRDDPGATGPERVLLTDFGIAKARDEATALTRTGTLLATLRYASPEQLEGKPLDPRSDQYSLGCTLFHLLAGATAVSDRERGRVDQRAPGAAGAADQCGAARSAARTRRGVRAGARQGPAATFRQLRGDAGGGAAGVHRACAAAFRAADAARCPGRSPAAVGGSGGGAGSGRGGCNGNGRRRAIRG